MPDERWPLTRKFFTLGINVNYHGLIINNNPGEIQMPRRIATVRDVDGRTMIAAPAAGSTSPVVGLAIETTSCHIRSFT